MNYRGLVKIVGLRFPEPAFEADDPNNLRLLVDVMIKNEVGSTISKDLKMNITEYGEYPIIGDVMWVMISGERLLIID